MEELKEEKKFTFPEGFNPVWLLFLFMLWNPTGKGLVDIEEYLTPEMKDALKKYEEDRKLLTKEVEENEHN